MVGVFVDGPTDPFMMMVPSLEHCDSQGVFATANFFHVVRGHPVR